MDWIIELIRAIPDILLYIVEGYIFVSVYNFILFKDNDSSENRTNFVLLKSIVISYIMKTLYDFGAYLIFGNGYETNQLLCAIILCVEGVILAYVFARVTKSRRFNKFLLNVLKIRRTVTKNIWNDVIREGSNVYVYSQDGKNSYRGQCAYFEENAREPLIVLTLFDVRDENGKIIAGYDFSQDPLKYIVFNLSDFEKVIIDQAVEQ